jgi:hypothetical protein
MPFFPQEGGETIRIIGYTIAAYRDTTIDVSGNPLDRERLED